jgi:hypothetical protein
MFTYWLFPNYLFRLLGRRNCAELNARLPPGKVLTPPFRTQLFHSFQEEMTSIRFSEGFFKGILALSAPALSSFRRGRHGLIFSPAPGGPDDNAALSGFSAAPPAWR